MRISSIITLGLLMALPLPQAMGVDTETVWRTITLADHNTRVVVFGCTCLGAAAGLVGTFLVLRRRALMGDTLGHATLPGVAIAFMCMLALGLEPRLTLPLMIGGALSALAAAVLVDLVRRASKLSDDTGLAAVLGMMFGGGLVLMGIIQQLNSGKASGLDTFIEGHVSSMLAYDAWQMAIIAVGVIVIILALFKELCLSTFDRSHARMQGYSCFAIDLIFFALIVIVTVAGLRAVGLILIIALLVIPAATALNCCKRLTRVALCATCLGAITGGVGAWVSALLPRLPTGAVIVLIATCLFCLSCLIGPARGWWWRKRTQRNAGSAIARA